MSELTTFGKGEDVEVTLAGLPKIIFKSISTKPDAPWLRQIAIATVRRFFFLTEDWSMTLRSERFPNHSGTIIIPEITNGERFQFDGASIPVPWLVSLITVGVLRPLGVLLVASIVHDYAFRYGYLKVRGDDGTVRDVPIDRHDADELFREIVTVVNGNRAVGRLAWYFVRLGYWLGVKYNGKPRTGRPPTLVAISFVAALGLLGLLIWHYSLPVVAVTAVALYLAFYLVTLRALGALPIPLFILSLLGILGVCTVCTRVMLGS
ncbi:MAG: DUF1353 domain-containing protein [Pseudomonadota bacterium]